MPKEDTTTQKEDLEYKELKRDILKLEHNSQETRKKRNSREKKVNLVILSFNLILVIVSLYLGAWLSLFFIVNVSLWIAVLWLKELHVNNLRFIIDMLTGIRDIEEKHAKLAASKKKEKANASTNASTNRKK